MYRTHLNKLKEWKLDKWRKPLVLLGARQVGKTWLLQEFARQEYAKVVYINFERATELREVFQHSLDPKRLLLQFEFYSGMKITPEDTLVILDEIQVAPRGITALKYFCEEMRELPIIAAGLLLGVTLHPDESFPVGKVNSQILYPMSFYEFLLAVGEENGLARVIREKAWDITPTFADKFKEYLKYYFYVGGMPEAVSAFTEEKDWTRVREVQTRILSDYRKDFSKHAPKEILPRINLVWDNIPAQLAKENKKFIYGVLREGARAREFEIAIQWLVDAGLLHKVCNVSKPAVPLVAYQELTSFKLYHNDVGLLGAMLNLKAKTIVNGNAVFEEFKGALTENFVFQQLNLNSSLKLNYHASENGRFEIDFIVQSAEDDLIPIEVKAGENLRAKSFRNFCEKYKPPVAFRTSLSDYKKESWMTNVPLYLIGDFYENR